MKHKGEYDESFLDKYSIETFTKAIYLKFKLMNLFI